MKIILLTIYILGIFGSFFLGHLFDIFNEDNDRLMIWIAVIWPLSVPIFFICAIFFYLAEKAEELRIKMREKENK